MASLLVITCLLFQTAVAVYLLNIDRVEDDMDKNLRKLLIILLFHLTTKFLLLTVLHNKFLYTQIPTGFGLAYGPLLLVMARSFVQRPMSKKAVMLQFLPFLVFSLVYIWLVVTGSVGWTSKDRIIQYAGWYEWLVIASLVGYPLFVRRLLRGHTTVLEKARKSLLQHIAIALLAGIGTGIGLMFLHWFPLGVPDFALRLLPYICFSSIPVMILRYRLRHQGAVTAVVTSFNGSAQALPFDAAGSAVSAPPVDMSAVLPSVGATQTIGQLWTPADKQSVPPDQATEVLTAGEKRYEKSGMDAAMLDQYEAGLKAFMVQSKIYLDPDLSLEQLAGRMKMAKHHLTQLLNDRLHKNFYSYINELRISESLERLKDPELEVNILSLAFDCGFNSRSSFNNYFKKITGYTPSAYRKTVIEAAQSGLFQKLLS
jgi:AraC-like DNA-binding protein